MKKDGNRISLTIKEADEIREYLETLYAMEGTLDEDFNSECHYRPTAVHRNIQFAAL